MILLDPNHLERAYPDERSAEIMRKTVGFFEAKGKEKLLADYYARPWYADFLEFVKKERIFASMCTPEGEGAPDARWDTWRICEFAEILGFYGLQYWYTWQVSVLGLGPIWPTSTPPTWCSPATETAGAPTGASTTSATATKPPSSPPSGASRTTTSTCSSPPIRATRTTT
jgi:hypothetical protein